MLLQGLKTNNNKNMSLRLDNQTANIQHPMNSVLRRNSQSEKMYAWPRHRYR